MNSLLDALGAAAGVLAFIAFVGVALERLLERFVKPIPVVGEYCAYVSLIGGVALAVGFQIDLLTPLAVSVGLHPLTNWLGIGVTGLGLGAGSNFWSTIGEIFTRRE